MRRLAENTLEDSNRIHAAGGKEPAAFDGVNAALSSFNLRNPTVWAIKSGSELALS